MLSTKEVASKGFSKWPRQRRSGLSRSAVQYRLRIRRLTTMHARRKSISIGRGMDWRRQTSTQAQRYVLAGDRRTNTRPMKCIGAADFGSLAELGDLVLHLRRELCSRIQPLAHTSVPLRLRPDGFPFNADNPAVRVPSARQLVYADTRANPKASARQYLDPAPQTAQRIPPDHDIGTFPSRRHVQGAGGVPWLPNAEQLLGRIVRCSSKPDGRRTDPFGGSGTTYSVAKSWDGNGSVSIYRRITCSGFSSLEADLRGRSTGWRGGSGDQRPVDGQALRPRRRPTPGKRPKSTAASSTPTRDAQGLSADHSWATRAERCLPRSV